MYAVWTLKVWPNYWKIVGKICTSRKPALHKRSVPVCGEQQRVRCQQSSGELGVSMGYYVFMKSKASQMKKKKRKQPQREAILHPFSREGPFLLEGKNYLRLCVKIFILRTRGTRGSTWTRWRGCRYRRPVSASCHRSRWCSTLSWRSRTCCLLCCAWLPVSACWPPASPLSQHSRNVLLTPPLLHAGDREQVLPLCSTQKVSKISHFLFAPPCCSQGWEQCLNLGVVFGPGSLRCCS